MARRQLRMAAEGSICKIRSAATATEEKVSNCGAEVKKSKLVIVCHLFNETGNNKNFLEYALDE